MRKQMNKVADEILKNAQGEYGDEYDVSIMVYAKSDELMDLMVDYVGTDIIEGLLNNLGEVYLNI